MRSTYKLLFLIYILLAAGCSRGNGNIPLAPPPDSDLKTHQPGSPIETKRDAITVGNQMLLEKGGIIWMDSPEVAFAKEMTYVEAVKQIGLDIAQYSNWPEQTEVWLVVLKGSWQLIPLDPNQANPQPLSYTGCGYVLFTAVTGEFMAMGDAVCPTP